MRAPRRLIVTIAAGALAVAGGSTLAAALRQRTAAGRTASATVIDDRGHHNGNAVLRSALFGSKTTPHGGPTLFDVAPGGIDWVINGKGTAKVNRDGRVRVRIEGLVFAEGPNVGKNTVPQLGGHRVLRRRRRRHDEGGPFSPRATPSSTTTLATALPSPCLTPAVLINPAPAGTAVTATYIAASGA